MRAISQVLGGVALRAWRQHTLTSVSRLSASFCIARQNSLGSATVSENSVLRGRTSPAHRFQGRSMLSNTQVVTRGLSTSKKPKEGAAGGSGFFSSSPATVEDIVKAKGAKYYCCSKDDIVYSAISEMVKYNIGSLVVVEPHKDKGHLKPIGIVTERDYMEKGIVKGRSSKETYVSEIMSVKGLILVHPDAKLMNCMELMTAKHVRHIPVVDKQQRLVGMISIGDVVKEIVNSQKKEMAQMQSFMAGTY